MFFDTSFKPEIICHEDKTRVNITTVELVREGNGHFLVATNGVSLIKVPCSGVSDDEVCGPVQPEAFDIARKLAKKAKKAKKAKSSVAEIRCGRDLLTFADGSTTPRVSHGDARFPDYQPRFPDYQRVIPENHDTRPLDAALWEHSKKERSGPYVLKMGLDPALLAELVKAQGRKGVVELTITIEPPHAEEKDTCTVHAPIVLRYDDAIGVVMPGRV